MALFHAKFLLIFLNLPKGTFSITSEVNTFAIQNATANFRQNSSSTSSSITPSIQYTSHSTRSSYVPIKEASSSQARLGDYIASGLGLSKSLEGSSSTRDTEQTASNPTSVAFSGNSSVNSYKTKNGTQASSQIPPNFSHVSATSAPFTNVSGNFTFDSGNCWSDWMSFWSVNSSVNAIETTTASATTTLISPTTVTNTDPGEVATTSTSIEIFTETETRSANGFTYETTTITSTTTYINSQSERPASTYTTEFTETYREGSSYYVTTPHIKITTPACRLPSSVPQCQASWDGYASLLSVVSAVPAACTTGYSQPSSCSAIISTWGSVERSLNSLQLNPPSCTQASVGPSACSQFYGLFISEWRASNYPGADPAGGNFDPYLSFGYQQTYITEPNGSVSASTYWPTSSILAPGCSVGCGPCAITGGTVRLLYWPVTETGLSNSSTPQPSPRDSPITAFAFGTSFVSPTVYISYHNIYASDSCGLLGTTHSTTIVPLSNSAQLSSVWRTYSGMLADATASFNYTDLNPPVPQSIYDRQPQCASWSQSYLIANQLGTGIISSDWICPRTGPYAPILGG